MEIGLIGPSYTAKSNVIDDEELINMYPESIASPGAQTRWSYLSTPGLLTFCALPEGPTRGSIWTGQRAFVAADTSLYEIMQDGTFVNRMEGVLDTFGAPVSMAFSTIELMVVAGGRAWCYNLGTNTYLEVTPQLAGPPLQVQYGDGFFIVSIQGSNKFQISSPLDGTTWPGLQVNEVSVFPENITAMLCIHRELWIFGSQHVQPYQDTGSDEIYDVIPGALMETGNGPSFAPCIVDNSIFWVSEDIRGARECWRANGYSPLRISNYAVEAYLGNLPSISGLVSYSYQDSGHLFWVLYIPNTDCTWVYDVAEQVWHKRAEWHQDIASWTPHRSWNHIWAFGKHLVGDWQTGNVNQMEQPVNNNDGTYSFVTDNGELIRRYRRSPTIAKEMQWIYHKQLVIDFATGLGPQPPLTDGDGNPRAPQAILRWSDDRGSTWSNQHVRECGFAGQYKTRVLWLRLGRSRYRVYEISMTDPIPWTIVSGYLEVSE